MSKMKRYKNKIKTFLFNETFHKFSCALHFTTNILQMYIINSK